VEELDPVEDSPKLERIGKGWERKDKKWRKTS
jgi:hypothetical protein